jgi:hypothetical protein
MLQHFRFKPAAVEIIFINKNISQETMGRHGFSYKNKGGSAIVSKRIFFCFS